MRTIRLAYYSDCLEYCQAGGLGGSPSFGGNILVGAGAAWSIGGTQPHPGDDEGRVALVAVSPSKMENLLEGLTALHCPLASQ